MYMCGHKIYTCQTTCFVTGSMVVFTYGVTAGGEWTFSAFSIPFQLCFSFAITGISRIFAGCYDCPVSPVLSKPINSSLNMPRTNPSIIFLTELPHLPCHSPVCNFTVDKLYEGHLESKERFAIKKYLLIIGKKKNMQVLSHTFTYFST
jgi:hypothetical protein